MRFSKKLLLLTLGGRHKYFFADEKKEFNFFFSIGIKADVFAEVDTLPLINSLIE